MKNKYLKDFIVLRQNKKPTTITVAFSLLLSNRQELEYLDTRFGKGYASVVYRINTVSEDIKQPEERIVREARNIDFLVETEEEFDRTSDHITSLLIIHNPAMDRESMTTMDAPTI